MRSVVSSLVFDLNAVLHRFFLQFLLPEPVPLVPALASPLERCLFLYSIYFCIHTCFVFLKPIVLFLYHVVLLLCH